MFLAVVLVVFGLPIMIGGLWLITLGGSWYYFFAEMNLMATSWHLFRRDLMEVWVHLFTYFATVIWPLWEAGLDPWGAGAKIGGADGGARPDIDDAAGAAWICPT